MAEIIEDLETEAQYIRVTCELNIGKEDESHD